MTDKKEFVANSLKEAIQKAAEEFGIEEEKSKYRIITEKTKYFGHKQREIFIEAWRSDGSDSKGLEQFIGMLIDEMKLDLSSSWKTTTNFLRVNFTGEDYRLMLYQNGNLLNAVQYLLNRLFADEIGKKIYCECENYRKKKEVELSTQAHRYARQVRRKRQGRRAARAEPFRAAHHPHDHQQIHRPGVEKRRRQFSEGHHHPKKSRMDDDTIVALATPPGQRRHRRIIRISGSRSEADRPETVRAASRESAARRKLTTASSTTGSGASTNAWRSFSRPALLQRRGHGGNFLAFQPVPHRRGDLA